eukprot:9088392-Pyramimonas_sp.AAC.1
MEKVCELPLQESTAKLHPARSCQHVRIRHSADVRMRDPEDSPQAPCLEGVDAGQLVLLQPCRVQAVQ